MSIPNLDNKEYTVRRPDKPASTWRTIGRVTAIVAGVVVVLIVLTLVFIDPLLNWLVKGKLTAAVNEQGGQELSIQSLHYSVFDNALFLEGITYNRRDTAQDGIATLKVDTKYISIGGASWFGLLFGSGLQLDELMFQSPRIAMIHTQATARDTTAIDTTSGAKSVADMLAEALPDKLRPLRVKQILVDNGTFTQQHKGRDIASDSIANVFLTIDGLAVDSIGSGTKLYSSVNLRTSAVAWELPESDYAVRADSVAFSSADSAESHVEMFALSFQPVISDKQFFDRRTFRTVRFRVTSPRFAVQGGNLRDILSGGVMQARSISMTKPVIDILLNKRLPVDPASPPAKMPHEIIADIETPFQIDTVAIDNGTIRYSELFPYDDNPALLRFTNVRVRCTDIAKHPQENNASSPASILATGNLAGAGPLRVEMKLPLHSKTLNFTYTGKLGAMKAEALNEFLSVSDRIQITSGDVESAGFTITVSDGKASGTVQAIYKNLKIQTLNEKSGKAGGLIESFKTFLANTFKIRSDNMPGDVKTGKVNYIKKPDDAFMDVVWLSLRGGLGEIVGF